MSSHDFPSPGSRPGDEGENDDVFELELTTMAHGGSAIGRHNGRAIFVPYAIPGERITARIVQDRGRFAMAEGVTLLEPSEARIYPRCPHFGPGRCGGCQWQHIDYPAQLDFKRQVVIDQLARIGGFQDAYVHPTLPSPDPWQYRSRVTFRLTDDGRLGFVATDDQHIIPIEECHIIRPELLDLFEQLQVEMRGALEPPPEDAGPTRPLAPDDGEPVPDYAALSQVRLQVGSASDDLLVSLRTINDELPSVQIDLPVQVSFLNEDGDSLPLIGPGLVTYNVMGRTFRVTAGGFFQVNLPQAEALVRLVLEKLALKGGESVLDLYSGVGLFSAFLAREASLVTSVESFGAAVSDAEFNLLDMPNVELIEGTVEDTLAELDGPFDAAVCDPPRTGMEPAALDALARHAPGRLVYVSCDPATFARDAKRLAAHGYRLIEVQPVDMFPQTFHIELVALLER